MAYHDAVAAALATTYDGRGDLLIDDLVADLREKVDKVSLGGDAASRRRSEYSEKDVLEVLKREGYIRHYTVDQTNPGGAITIELKYHEGAPVIRAAMVCLSISD